MNEYLTYDTTELPSRYWEYEDERTAEELIEEYTTQINEDEYEVCIPFE